MKMITWWNYDEYSTFHWNSKQLNCDSFKKKRLEQATKKLKIKQLICNVLRIELTLNWILIFQNKWKTLYTHSFNYQLLQLYTPLYNYINSSFNYNKSQGKKKHKTWRKLRNFFKKSKIKKNRMSVQNGKSDDFDTCDAAAAAAVRG